MKYSEKRKIISDDKQIKYWTIILSLILVFLYFGNLYYSQGIVIVNDEFGYWGIAASWAGYDWSELLSITPYYSFGYSCILTLLFHLFSNTVLMYQVALLINVVLILLSFFLAFECGKKLFPDFSQKKLILICFSIMLYTNNIVQAKLAWSETLLYFMNWLLLFLAIRVVYENRYLDTITYAVCTVYVYYIHQRALGILISSIFLMVLLVFFKKKTINHFFCFGIVLTILFILGVSIKNFNINNFFTSKELVAANDYSGQTTKLGYIFGSFEGIRYLLESICGKLYYFSCSSFILGFYALGYLIKEILVKLIKIIKKISKSIENDWFVKIYIIASFMTTFAISAIYMYVSIDRLDMLIYGRYMEFAFGPFLMIGLVLLLDGRIQIKEILAYVSITIILSILVNNVFISLGTESYNGICIASLTYFFSKKVEIPGLALWIVFYAIGVLSLCRVMVNSKKHRHLGIYIAIILITLNWIEFSDYSGMDTLHVNVMSEMKELSEYVYNIEGNEDIYVLNDSEISERYSKYIQFYLPNKKVHYIDASTLRNTRPEENSVFVSLNKDKEIIKEYSSMFRIIDETKSMFIFVV